MRTSESQVEISKALADFHAEMTSVKKGSANPFFKSNYADLSDIKSAADPLLAKHGLSVTQHPEGSHDDQVLTTRLMHASGEWQESTMPLYIPKADAQGQGSAVTYGRRYAYSAIVGIATEDDDGNAATATTPSHTFEKRKRPNTKPTDYITANEANEITEILNLIEDESKRNLAKLDFVSVFGKPTEVVTGMADRARDYAQGKLEESMR